MVPPAEGLLAVLALERLRAVDRGDVRVEAPLRGQGLAALAAHVAAVGADDRVLLGDALRLAVNKTFKRRQNGSLLIIWRRYEELRGEWRRGPVLSGVCLPPIH